MVKKIFVIILLLILREGIHNNLYAFRVEPVFQKISLSPGQKGTLPLQISRKSNNIDKWNEVVVYRTNEETDRRGKEILTRTPNTPHSILPFCKMRMSDKNVKDDTVIPLDPNSAIELTIEFDIPPHTAPGGYYGAILVVTKTKSVSEQAPLAIQANSAIASIIHLTVEGNLKLQADIQDLKIDNNKIFVSVINKGNMDFLAQVTAQIVSLPQQRIYDEIKLNVAGQERTNEYIHPEAMLDFEASLMNCKPLSEGNYKARIDVLCLHKNMQKRLSRSFEFKITTAMAQTIWGKIPLIDVSFAFPAELELTIPVNGKISKAITIANYRKDEITVKVSAEETWIEVKQTNFILRGETERQIMILISNPSEEEKKGRIIFNAFAGKDEEQKIIIIKVKKPEKKGVRKNAKIFNLFNDNSFYISRVRGAQSRS